MDMDEGRRDPRVCRGWAAIERADEERRQALNRATMVRSCVACGGPISRDCRESLKVCSPCGGGPRQQAMQAVALREEISSERAAKRAERIRSALDERGIPY